MVFFETNLISGKIVAHRTIIQPIQIACIILWLYKINHSVTSMFWIILKTAVLIKNHIINDNAKMKLNKIIIKLISLEFWSQSILRILIDFLSLIKNELIAIKIIVDVSKNENNTA